MIKRFVPLAAAIVLASPTAEAHPGHGTLAPDSLWHYLAEPVHAALAVTALAVGAVGAVGASLWAGRRRVSRKSHRRRVP